MSNLTNWRTTFWSLRRADPARIGQQTDETQQYHHRKVEHGVDTAWLVDHHTEDFTASYAVQHWLDVAAQQKTVAITLRELAPFDKRLGTTQQAYEKPCRGGQSHSR